MLELLRISLEFLEDSAFIEFLTKIFILSSRKLLKVTFGVHMVVDFKNLAVNVFENFRFLEFFFFFENMA